MARCFCNQVTDWSALMGKRVSNAIAISTLRILGSKKLSRKLILSGLINSHKLGGQKLNHYLIFAARASNRKDRGLGKRNSKSAN